MPLPSKTGLLGGILGIRGGADRFNLFSGASGGGPESADRSGTLFESAPAPITGAGNAQNLQTPGPSSDAYGAPAPWSRVSSEDAANPRANSSSPQIGADTSSPLFTRFLGGQPGQSQGGVPGRSPRWAAEGGDQQAMFSLPPATRANFLPTATKGNLNFASSALNPSGVMPTPGRSTLGGVPTRPQGAMNPTNPMKVKSRMAKPQQSLFSPAA